MGKPSRKRTVEVLLGRHGQTFAEEAHIRLGDDPKPSPLYRLLCLATLLSAPMRSEAAVEASRALSSAGWRTATSMAGSTWQQRVKVLNQNGYARYDESTARMLGDTAEMLLDRWRGDLRRLRDEAERDPELERDLLMKAKGIGGGGRVDLHAGDPGGLVRGGAGVGQQSHGGGQGPRPGKRRGRGSGSGQRDQAAEPGRRPRTRRSGGHQRRDPF